MNDTTEVRNTIATTETHSEGTITTRRGRVTISLRRAWAVTQGAGDLADVRWLSMLLARIWRWIDSGVKIAVVAAWVYFAFEIVRAFLPGGAVDRVTGGF